MPDWTLHDQWKDNIVNYIRKIKYQYWRNDRRRIVYTLKVVECPRRLRLCKRRCNWANITGEHLTRERRDAIIEEMPCQGQLI